MLVGQDDDVDCRITDFGLAKRDNACKTFCGTPAYFAPEVLERQSSSAGEGEYGKEADMWSLGVLAYVVLSGAPAFDGNSMEDKIIQGRFNPMTGKRWDKVSADAKSFIAALIIPSPQLRLTASQARQHAWISSASVQSACLPEINTSENSSHSSTSTKRPVDSTCNEDTPESKRR